MCFVLRKAKRELFLQGRSPSTGEVRGKIYSLTACTQWQPTGCNSSFYCNKELDRTIDKP